MIVPAFAITAAMVFSVVVTHPNTAAAQSANCFAPDVGAASLDRSLHYNWARAHATAEVRRNLENKLVVLFACPTRTASQLSDTFADLSLVVARYVPNPACFSGDAGVVNTDRKFHHEWALTKSRDTLASNARWKVLAAFDCLDRARQADYFADISVVLASGNLS